MNRFFIPKYISNSVRIKLKASALKRQNGSYPYDYFKERIEYDDIEHHNVQYLDEYYSFAYFNSLATAEKYYKKRPITVQIMIGIIQYNEDLKLGHINTSKLLETAQKITKQTTYKNGLPHFMIEENFAKFDVHGTVFSGIIQAKAASFFLRVYKATGDNKYLGWAKSALQACLKTRNEGGIMIQNEFVKAWIEEYDSPKPSMVLNGFIFTLIAAAELLAHEENYPFRAYLQKGLQTLKAWLPCFKSGNDILYSMYHWDLCNIHYMGVMEYQFDHLAMLTGDKTIQEFSKLIKNNYDKSIFLKMIH